MHSAATPGANVVASCGAANAPAPLPSATATPPLCSGMTTSGNVSLLTSANTIGRGVAEPAGSPTSVDRPATEIVASTANESTSPLAPIADQHRTLVAHSSVAVAVIVRIETVCPPWKPIAISSPAVPSTLPIAGGTSSVSVPCTVPSSLVIGMG